METFGKPTVFHKEVGSTQDLIRELATQGAHSGLVVAADHQTQGRGRQGRVWHSLPAPQLYFSILLAPDLETSKLPLITITAGLAVAQALEAESFSKITIKWPNDIYLNGKKVSGILAEAFSIPSGGTRVALGVGVNISGKQGDFPPDLDKKATTLSIHRESENPPDRVRLRTSILHRFEELYALLIAGEVQTIQKEIQSRSSEILPFDKIGCTS